MRPQDTTSDKELNRLLRRMIADGKSGTPLFKKTLAQLSDIDTPTIGGTTLLHLACSLGKPMALKTLIQAGADIDSMNMARQTPLDRCIELVEIDCAKVLIGAGCSCMVRFHTVAMDVGGRFEIQRKKFDPAHEAANMRVKDSELIDQIASLQQRQILERRTPRPLRSEQAKSPRL